MDTTFEATIDEEGTIRLPEQIASRLGLRPGTTLIVEQDQGSGFNLRVADDNEHHLINKDGVLVIDAAPLVDIDQFIQSQRSERMLHLLGD